MRSLVYKAVLNGLHYSGMSRLLGPMVSGFGAIFMLHRIEPPAPDTVFAPNAALSVTPEFLDALLLHLEQLGIPVVTLDEACRRLQTRRNGQRFVCFTIDDGYRDNYEVAYPIFRKHNAPFTVYVTTGFIDGTAWMWWYIAEAIIRREDRVRFVSGGSETVLPAASLAEKHTAYQIIAGVFRGLDEDGKLALAERMAEDYGIDNRDILAREMMTWNMIREMSDSGLVEIGAHTVTHPMLRKKSEEAATFEIGASRDIIESRLGRPVRHFAYPFGDRESVGRREFAIVESLGFASAVTTRKGTVQPEHARNLYAIPRISLIPPYMSSMRYIDTFMSGVPFVLWNRGRRVVME